jgi:hypothetical protein
MFNRAEVQKLMHKVHTYPIPDGKRWSSTIGYNDVSIVTSRGSFSMRVDQTPGSPKTPLPDSQIDAKFLDCASSSITSENAIRSLYLLRNLSDLVDCRAVFDSLRQKI